MAKYRKKPVVIEAVQWSGDNFKEVGNFIEGDHKNFPKPRVVIIPTLEGEMTASEGDFIIKGVNGEVYPCKPDIFEKTYVPVNGLYVNVDLQNV
jgi:hypothetical protein